MIRNQLLRVRLTKAEAVAIQAKATAAGLTVSDFCRHRLLDYRLRQTGPERDILRHLARIGGNVNQLARWANAYKSRLECLEVVSLLAELQAEVKALALGPCT